MRQKMRKIPGAVDARRLQQILRDGDVVVAAEQRREAHALHDVDQHQAADRVEQTKVAQHDDPRHQPHLFGQEHAKRHDAEHDGVAAEPPQRQRIAVQRAEQRRDDGGGNHHPHRVPEIRLDAVAMLRDAVAAPGSAEVAPHQLARQADDAAVVDLLGAAQRVQHHDHQRHQEEGGEGDQHGMDRHARQGDAVRHGRGPFAAATCDTGRRAPARRQASPAASPPQPNRAPARRAGT